MKKLFLIATIAMGLVTTSCDSYLDINQNPNSPQESDMTPSILMPAAEMSLAASYGDLFRIPTAIMHSILLRSLERATIWTIADSQCRQPVQVRDIGS